MNMAILTDFNAIFSGIPMPKSPFDGEQHAPFTLPTDAEVQATREGVEEAKRRNRDATPPAQHRKSKGSEL